MHKWNRKTDSQFSNWTFTANFGSADEQRIAQNADIELRMVWVRQFRPDDLYKPVTMQGVSDYLKGLWK